MAKNAPTEKVWLQDDKGNYYMLTADVLEAIKVPASHKKEVEEVINGQDEAAGFTSFGTTTAGAASLSSRVGSFSLANTRVSTVGRCMCGRNFGVTTTVSKTTTRR
jgi:hypothetical protein